MVSGWFEFHRVGAAVFADGDVLCDGWVAHPVVEADLRGDGERCTVVKCVLVKHDGQRPALAVLRWRGPFFNCKGDVAVGVDVFAAGGRSCVSSR